MKKKFQLGDFDDEKELMKTFRKDDPIKRVQKNCEIRIRNHVTEIKKLNISIDDMRKAIRAINIKPVEDLPGRLSQELQRDVLGQRIKNLVKWRRHLRADIKFLNNQKSILEKSE
jgi:hypothetical protein